MVKLKNLLVGIGILGTMGISSSGTYKNNVTPSYKNLESKLETENFDSIEDKFIEIIHSDWAKNLDYKLGGKNPSSGSLDCSGFVYYVLDESLKNENFKLKKVLDNRKITNTAVVHIEGIYNKYGQVEDEMPSDFGEYVGDVIFFENSGRKVSRHIGFAIKDWQQVNLVHCSSGPGNNYKNERFDENSWNKRGFEVKYGRVPESIRKRMGN